MNKQKKLGQHFLKSKTVAKKIVEAAEISKDDIVLEIGTGKGVLLPFLCHVAKEVISYEKDKQLFFEAKNLYGHLKNLKLINEDGFRTKENFSIFVSNLPYSQSRRAIEWLCQKKYSRAIVMVQDEFALKLMADGNERRPVSVLVNYSTEINKVMKVNKTNFIPPPKVNSQVLKFVRRNSKH